MSARNENIYDDWTRDERSEKRGLRLSLAVAAILHGALLLVAVPQYSEVQAAPADEGPIFVVQTPRFKKPPPPPTEIPPRPTEPIPVPDPDPLAPEPFVSDEELAPLPEIEVDEGVIFSFPDAPPAPPEPDRVYRVGEVEPPERLRFVEPRYTELARRARTEGMVILQATIDPRGDVVDVQVLRGLPMGLTEAAIEAVEQWKFRPSTVDGRPVAVLYNLTVRFALR